MSPMPSLSLPLRPDRAGLRHLRCFLFPPMENLLTHLKTKNFQGRTVGLMENGTWAPMLQS